MTHWAFDSVFYHIYPLGLCGAPAQNDYASQPVPRLDALRPWIDHMLSLGVNALYLGPVFESATHGYDTTDYYHVDRRLGGEETLAGLAGEMRARGIRVVLDAVFNHVGRDFWAFRDLRERGRESPYADWFHQLDFSGRSPYGDPFSYEGWGGHHSLVKLNLRNPDVKRHLFDATDMWIRRFGIDGLRLDAADCMDVDFLRELGAFCRGLRPDFWLVGEAVHGDYRTWAGGGMLDSVTNYEVYKGLYSSHVDKNYFEIAYALNRQFGEGGMYRDIPLYNFADNHDVNRVASMLKKSGHLYPLYCLLFTIPGVPSVYYGSEWGLRGERTPVSDAPLRPALDLAAAARSAPESRLPDVIARLARIRRNSAALRYGDYTPVDVKHEQLAFLRRAEGEQCLVAVNAADKPAVMTVALAETDGTRLVDLLNPGESFEVRGGKARLDPVWPQWARVLRVEWN